MYVIDENDEISTVILFFLFNVLHYITSHQAFLYFDQEICRRISKKRTQ